MINFTKLPGQKVLELGGGFNRHPHSDVNVDVREGQGVDFTVDFNREEWPEIGSDEFDVVYACFVLEHISWRQTVTFLKQVRRVLKPGGRAIFVVPNTEAQMRYILSKPEFDGDEGSMLFGTLDYPENSHRAAFSPRSITKHFTDAGFEGIIVTPFGEPLKTDMVVEASKPGAAAQAEEPDIPLPPPGEIVMPKPEQGNIYVVEQPPPLPARPPEEIYSRDYFEHYGGGGFYWDYPHHEVVARKVLALNPESVVELGCARGYILKRLQDHGLRVQGVDVSHHAWLTRVCDPVSRHDLLEAPWPLGKQEFDLAFSLSLLEHIPEQALTVFMDELGRVSKRGLHGVVFQGGEPGRDATRCTLKSKEFWERILPEGHQVVDARELSAGDLPEEVKKGEGRIKLNLGCAWTCFHHGWENVDHIDAAGFAQAFGYTFKRHDLRVNLPYATGIVDLIFTSHMLEHLTYDEGLRLLRECRRVIRPDGYMRIVVPDAYRLATGMDGCGPDLAEFDHVNEACAKSSTRAAKLWALLGEGHKAFYDQDTLSHLLQEAGWEPHPSSFRQVHDHPGSFQIARECVEMSYGYSLFCNATPKRG